MNEEIFIEDMPQSSETDTASSHFENYDRNIVSTVAYLIGVPEEYFREDLLMREVFDELSANENATVVRHLSILRCQLFENSKQIDSAFKMDMFKGWEDIPDLVSRESLKYLRERDIRVTDRKDNFTVVAHINQHLQDRVDRLKPLFPVFVNFDYIKPLFLIKGGNAGKNGSELKRNEQKIKNAIYGAKAYLMKKNCYPYRRFVSWPRPLDEKDGNILFNDNKFLSRLYLDNNDEFTGRSYVIDARKDTVEGIYEFVATAEKAAIFVDCENLDPYYFVAMLASLPKNSEEKISKIVLFDDPHASTAWDNLSLATSVPIVHNEVTRVLEGKSMVDGMMIAGIATAHYTEGVESIILATSDCDFLATVYTFKTARFFALNEHSKVSPATINEYEKYGVSHCYINDFSLKKASRFKEAIMQKCVDKILDRFNSEGIFEPRDAMEIVDNLFTEARITGAENELEREKSAFYDKYLRKGFSVRPVEENGRFVFRMELNK